MHIQNWPRARVCCVYSWETLKLNMFLTHSNTSVIPLPKTEINFTFCIPFLSAFSVFPVSLLLPLPVPAYISQFFKKNLSYLGTVHLPFCATLHRVSPLSLYDNRVSCEYTALAGCMEAGSLTCGTNILPTLLWFITPSLHLLLFCLSVNCASSYPFVCSFPRFLLSLFVPLHHSRLH